MAEFSKKVRKHCGKRRNCSLRAISPFPTMFSKDLFCRHVKTRACLEKSKSISVRKTKVTEKSNCFVKGRKHCEKRRKCWLPAFSLFLAMFSKAFIVRVNKSKQFVGKG